MSISDEFSSFKAFLQAFDRFQASKSLKYEQTNSLSITSTNVETFQPEFIERFKYKYIRYRCSLCTANLTVRLIHNEKLRITVFNNEHNHPIRDGGESIADEREQILQDLNQIKHIVSTIPTDNLGFAGAIVTKFMQKMMECQRNGFNEPLKGSESSGEQSVLLIFLTMIC